MDYGKILETYTLSEIIEWNDIEEEEILQFLVEEYLIELPPVPIDA